MAEGALTEQVAEGLEETAEIVRDFTNRDYRIFFYGLGLGVVTGFAIGYFFQEKRLEKKYTKFIEKEIDEMREHFHQRATAAPVTEKPPLEDVVKDLRYTEEEEAAIAEVAENLAEVEEELPEWDYAIEIKKRGSAPFVIHVDEYNDNEGDYEQTTYTYFEADDVLIDVRDNRVEPIDEIVGNDNLLLFGHGSNDPNIVYVRNNDLSMDIEISRSPGSFAEEVHGVIEHSEKKRRKRERRFDDD